MSSDSERDVGDYVTDDSQQEDGTLFLPAPERPNDPSMRLCSGILAGLAGGVLVPVSAWLAGGLIAFGYGLAAFTLKGSANNCTRAVCFGFGITALLGVALVAGEAAAPVAVQHLILRAGERHLIFASFALMPWAFAVLKLLFVFLYALVARPKRRKGVRAASRV